MSDDQEEIKEWVRASTSAQHITIVTVSLVQGTLSSKKSAKASNHIVEGDSVPDVKRALKTARAAARRMLTDVRQALGELDLEES